MIPVAGYFGLKYFGNKAVVMPRHYIFDSIITKEVNGKLVEDTVWHKLPNFALTNQMGRTVGWEDIKGKVVVANFFFTHCPSICPKMTLNMKKLQEGIKANEKVGNRQADFLHFISYSVDPERDSVTKLKKWADHYSVNPERWWLLTGNKKDIYDLSIEHMKLGAIDGKGIDTSFFHTDYMVLIDRNQHIRGYYHGLDTNAIQRLSKDIIFLALEKDPNRKKLFDGKLEIIVWALALAALGIGLLMYFLNKDKKNYEPVRV